MMHRLLRGVLVLLQFTSGPGRIASYIKKTIKPNEAHYTTPHLIARLNLHSSTQVNQPIKIEHNRTGGTNEQCRHFSFKVFRHIVSNWLKSSGDDFSAT